MMRSRSFANRRSIIPVLETLEGRDCPSVNAAVFGHTLMVRGDDAANEVTITDDGQGSVSATIDGTTVDGKNVRHIIVLTGSGDDSVTYTASGSLSASRHLLINVGQGDDNVTVDAAQGITSGFLNLAILGGQGADTIDVSLGAIEDRARALVMLHGAGGDDNISATSTGALNGKLALGIFGAEGNDTLAADITVDADSTGRLAAFVQGGSGDDDLTLNVNDGTVDNGESGLDFFRALIVGGSGTNTVQNTDNVTVKSK